MNEPKLRARMSTCRQRPNLSKDDRAELVALGEIETLCYGQMVSAKALCDKYEAGELLLRPGRIIQTHVSQEEEAFLC